jgi:hypothetical protein
MRKKFSDKKTEFLQVFDRQRIRKGGSSGGGTPTTRPTTPTSGSHFAGSQTRSLLTYRISTATDLGPTTLMSDPGAGSVIVGATGVAQGATVAEEKTSISYQNASRVTTGVSGLDLHDSPTV